jgi:hypothetical protein
MLETERGYRTKDHLDPNQETQSLFLSEMRSVEDDTHGQTTNGTGNGDGHDPREDKETDSLPVDGLEGTVAETDSDGGTSDAHGGGDGERVLREDQDGESGTHFHGATCCELA